MSDPLYRNHDWLKSKLDKGLTYKQIANLCDSTVSTIRDWSVYRFKLRADEKLPCVDHDYYRIKNPRMTTKVGIFGSTGFVGQNLIQFLKKKRIHVIEFSRGDADLMDLKQAVRCVKNFTPDVVINLAAIAGGIGLNKDNPAMMMYKNLQMGINVLHACYENNIRKYIYLGSVCAYPKIPKRIPFREEDMWDGRPEPTNEPYGLAKKTVGFLMDCYYKQYGYPSCYLIPTNMYGPHDDFSLYSSHVIPALINKYLKAKKDKVDVELWGDGTPSRDFLYVEDCCQAIWQAISRYITPEPINIGSGKETRIRHLSRVISKQVKFNGSTYWDIRKPNGQPRRRLNITKSKNLLDFVPKVGLDLGIKKTISWYKSDLRKKRS